ncbi:NucA/NucB deoxyribonuclease domain-containing protein [Actinomadura luteofluorescens]|uniref:NucA/NucB deoxyribonuclease domain-containing protein n=1 Tax=Actinomadura luteofluorescens TaxID=46163 RepID=UPI003D8EFDCE
MKTQRLAAACALLLALGLGVTTAPGASADPAPAPSASPLTTGPAPSPSTASPSPVGPTSSGTPSAKRPASKPSVSHDPSPPPRGKTFANRQELRQWFEERGCTLPEDTGGRIVGCFWETGAEPAASRAADAAWPDCPAPSHKDKIYYVRKYSCSHVNQIGTFVKADSTPEIIGVANTDSAFEERLDSASREWKRTVYFRTNYVTGELVESMLTATFSIDCGGTCGTPVPKTFIAQKGVVQQHDHFMESAGSSITFPQPQTKIKFAYPGAVIEGSEGNSTHLGPPTGVRCDSLTDAVSTGKPGCVYYWYTPTYEVKYGAGAPMPTIAENILFAQLALRSRPGFPGTGSIPGGQPLVRGPAKIADPKDGVLKDFDELSRRVSCPGSIPRPTGQTCDEYPFASTWQGAEWVPGDQWSCRFVPKAEQDYQGADIRKFHDDNRLWRNPTGKVTDTTGRPQGAYWVWVSNAPTTPPSFTQCQNHM